MTTFTMTLAQTIYDSNDQFPINFDDAWQWLGYSRRDSAKRTLVKNFERDFDFHINVEATTTGISTIPTELIYISIDCFKQLAMMAKTDIGKVARKYFIECERLAEEAKAAKITPTTADIIQLFTDNARDAARIKAYNDTQGDNAFNESLVYLDEINPHDDETRMMCLLMGTTRLKLEKDRSMNQVHCRNTTTKQFRHTRINRNGAKDVPLHLLPKSEQSDPENAVELNPSSKQSLLLNTRLDDKSTKQLKASKSKKLKPGTNQISLPKGVTIDLPGVYIEG